MPRMERSALSFLTPKLSIELFKLCPIDSIFWIKIIIFSTEYKKFLPLIKGEPLYPFVEGFFLRWSTFCFLRWSTFCFHIHDFFMFCIFYNIFIFLKVNIVFYIHWKSFAWFAVGKDLLFVLLIMLQKIKSESPFQAGLVSREILLERGKERRFLWEGDL